MVVSCDVCGLEARYSVCFLLKPCSHRACVKCFHEAVTASYALRCPCSDCHKWVTSSVLMELAGPANMVQTTAKVSIARSSTITSIEGTDENKLMEIQEVSHFEPDEQMDPFRHWAMKKPQLYTGFIYVSYRMKEDEAAFYKTNFKALNSTVFMDDSSSDELVKIFARILHPLLFRKDFLDTNAEHHRHGSITTARYDCEKENFPTAYVVPPPKTQRDQFLAMRCLYALCAGRVLSRQQQKEIEEGHHSYLERKAYACARFLARELIRTHKKSSTARESGRENLLGKFHKSSSAELASAVDEDSTLASDDFFPTYVLVFLLLSAVLMMSD